MMSCKRYLIPAGAAICAVALIFPAVCRAQAGTTVFLVRHAEKGTGDDPHLTPEGVARAQALVAAVGDAPIAAVYATDTCRTTQTAQWLAADRGLPIRVQDLGSPGVALDHCDLRVEVEPLPPSIGDADAIARYAVAEHAGEVVVMVGHSNTVPAILAALGAEPLCPGTFPEVDGKCHIPDEGEASQYDNLFVVARPADGKGVRLVHSKYGESAAAAAH